MRAFLLLFFLTWTPAPPVPANCVVPNDKDSEGNEFRNPSILIIAGLVWCRYARRFWCEGARVTGSVVGMVGAAAVMTGFFL